MGDCEDWPWVSTTIDITIHIPVTSFRHRFLGYKREDQVFFAPYMLPHHPARSQTLSRVHLPPFTSTTIYNKLTLNAFTAFAVLVDSAQHERRNQRQSTLVTSLPFPYVQVPYSLLSSSTTDSADISFSTTTPGKIQDQRLFRPTQETLSRHVRPQDEDPPGIE